MVGDENARMNRRWSIVSCLRSGASVVGAYAWSPAGLPAVFLALATLVCKAENIEPPQKPTTETAPNNSPSITTNVSVAKVEAEGSQEKKARLLELMNTEVTTVTRRASTVGESPAAVFVITQDDIRRSGVTSIPEAL